MIKTLSSSLKFSKEIGQAVFNGPIISPNLTTLVAVSICVWVGKISIGSKKVRNKLLMVGLFK